MPETNMPISAASSPSSVRPAGLDRRVSMAEISAFVAETNRMLNGGSASLVDRAAFFEWKADLFARLGEAESARTAAVEAARLRDRLNADGRGVA